MKTTKVYLIMGMTLLILMSACSDSGPIVKGNKKVVTRDIHISDYREIEISAPVKFEYEQSDAAPYLQVTTDENILEYLDIYVAGRELYIKARKKNGSHYVNLDPTVLVIRSNSTALTNVDGAGSTTFIVNAPLTGNSLEVDMAGSGKFYIDDTVRVHSLDFDLAGSGRIAASAPIYANNLDIDVSGSGEVRLLGEITHGEIEIAGSGKINALPCTFSNLECSISGSGDIAATVTDKLRYAISGSGKLSYKGNPQLNGTISGSGKIIDLN